MVVKRIVCPGCESEIDIEINVISHNPSEKLSALAQTKESSVSPEQMEDLRKKEKELKKKEEELARREEVVSKYEIELTKKEVEINSKMAMLGNKEASQEREGF